MDDEQIIELFNFRSQEALSHTARKYGRLLSHIAENILQDRQDAEEATSDAYLKLWQTIPPERPTYFQAYAVKLTRNAALDILRRRQRKKRDNRADVLYSELDECLPSDFRVEDRLDERELIDSINAYLATLDEKSRSMFIRRYFAMDELDELANDFGVSKHAVTVRLSRVKSGLKKYLKKEGVAV